MDEWEQVVSDSQAYKQFGNAVTTTVAQAVAEAIKEVITERNLQTGTQKQEPEEPKETSETFLIFDPLEELAEMLEEKKRQKKELEDRLLVHDTEIMALEMALEALKRKIS